MQGQQQPRVESVPDGVDHPDGQAASELVAAAGITLDPWQDHVFRRSLRVRGQKWAAFEVGLVCPRQNGKNELIVARELAGLFVLGERLLIHSAHQFDTSLEAFRRLVTVIEDNEWLDREVRRPGGIKRSHGEEGVELKNGQRIRFRTRTKGGGRGFSSDCLILDEAMILPESSHGALLPTLSARPNPQVWYTGSAVDQTVHPDGVVLTRVRERGLAGQDPALAFFEWSLDEPNPADLSPERSGNVDVWAQANPGLGIRISAAHIANERASMDPRTFAVERLGVGDWPQIDGDGSVISVKDWDGLADPRSRTVGPVVFAFDVSPDRRKATVSVCGRRRDGLPHVETVETLKGTAGLVDYLVARVEKNDPIAVVLDDKGPAGSLAPALEERGVKLTKVTANEHAQACGMLFDAVQQRKLRHLGTLELQSALRGASTRPLGEAWAWSRKSSSVDISPLVAGTLALWGLLTRTQKQPPRLVDLAAV